MGGMQRRWARGANRGHIKEEDRKKKSQILELRVEAGGQRSQCRQAGSKWSLLNG